MISICPGCGVALESTSEELDTRYYASRECVARMDEVNAWTLELHDPEFIHQLVICTYGASHWREGMKPITLAFALIGLYLACERKAAGKEIQAMHTRLSNASKTWPTFTVPDTKAALSIIDVLAVDIDDRPAMISEWTQSVWGIWRDQQEDIKRILDVL